MDGDLTLFRALRAIASHVNASGDVAETTERVLQAFCRESRWASAVVMRIDAEREIARVVARYDPGGLTDGHERLWPLSESPTRVVIETNAPVILPDAQVSADFPGYRREASLRGYRTVVLLPMPPDGGEPMVLAACSRDLVPVSERDIAFLQLVVHLGAIAVEKAHSLREEQAAARRLTTVLSRNATLLEHVLADGTVSALAALVAETLSQPFVVVDLATRRISCASTPFPDILDDAQWRMVADGEGRRQFLDLARQLHNEATVRSRTLALRLGDRIVRSDVTLVPLRVDGELVGALVVFAPPSALGELDHLLIDSARVGLSVQMMRAHVRFTTETRGRETLFAGLLSGTIPSGEIEERAARLDVIVEGSARLVVIATLAPTPLPREVAVECLRAISEVARHLGPRAAAFVHDGMVCVQGPWAARDEPRWARFVAQALEEVRLSTGGATLAVRSKICSVSDDYPPAYRECVRVVALARRFGRSGEITAQDFGPFPILMSAVETGAMQDFVQGLVGQIARHDERHGTAYLPTLSSFLDHGCRMRACAASLDLHVTTLRYRLSRLRELFAVELDTPDQRLSVQLALRFRDIMKPQHRGLSE